MQEMHEKDLGYRPRPSTDLDSPSQSPTSSREKDKDDVESTAFEPIRTRPASVATRGSRRSNALSHTRSNNGYGVDDAEDDDDVSDDDDGDTPPPQATPAEKDPFEVTWDNGDADPNNPRSLPHWRKWSIVIVTSVGSVCVTNASSIYTSTYTQMDAEFGNSRIVATLGLSFFVLGIALGPFWSPLAEFYGRRPIYLASFASFLIWLIPSAVAQNIQTMIVARFFQGLAGSAFLSVSGGTVSDMFARNQMQAAMAVFTLAPFAGPSLGPLFGGFINSNVSWRWTHYVLLIWAGVLLVTIYVFVPETYHPVLLKRKAQKLRKETGDDRWKAPIEKQKKSILSTVGHSLLRPFQLLLGEPMCLILDIYSAILLGILYLFFGAFPLVFGTNHGFNLWQTGLTFMGLFVGMAAACSTAPVWHNTRQRLAARRERKFGEARNEPEDQLPSVIVGAPLITVGLFWFGFTTYPSVHWIVPIIGSGVFAFGVSLAFTGIFTFLVDAYPLYAASALAGNALVRCTFAAAFPLFGIQMYERLGYQWATALLGFLTLAMLPFPYLFFIYGKKIRSRSKYATNA
ncbi:major facilitator superfamily domain-containing protein [Coniochaeta sp. 2T2.1]|nr:major facilitator superfamily domain-containing protein [Coniochaeta sp. 2T2.1]